MKLLLLLLLLLLLANVLSQIHILFVSLITSFFPSVLLLFVPFLMFPLLLSLFDYLFSVCVTQRVLTLHQSVKRRALKRSYVELHLLLTFVRELCRILLIKSDVDKRKDTVNILWSDQHFLA